MSDNEQLFRFVSLPHLIWIPRSLLQGVCPGDAFTGALRTRMRSLYSLLHAQCEGRVGERLPSLRRFPLLEDIQQGTIWGEYPASIGL